MENLGNLLLQRATIEKEIEAIKTKDVRASITKLEENSRNLLQKIADAKAYVKTSDVEIAKQIALHRAEIERLKNLSFTNIYKVSELENDLRVNGMQFAEQSEKLNSLLSGS